MLNIKLMTFSVRLWLFSFEISVLKSPHKKLFLTCITKQIFLCIYEGSIFESGVQYIKLTFKCFVISKSISTVMHSIILLIGY